MSVPTIDYQVLNYEYGTDYQYYCDGQSAPSGYIYRIDKAMDVKFIVSNPDCSSVYTWHGRDTYENWLTPVSGRERTVNYLGQTKYDIAVGQDNTGYSQLNSPPIASRSASIYLTRPQRCVLQYDDNIMFLNSNNSGVGQKSHISLKVSPTVVEDNCQVEIGCSENTNLSLQLYSSLGILVKEIMVNEKLSKGVFKKSFSTNNLAAGIYHIILKNETGIIDKSKIVKF